MLNREILLKKLTGYLNKEISLEDIYLWALGVAVSPDYEIISRSDLLAGQVIKDLVDLHHDDLKRVPTRKALEYYRDCLGGKEDYDPQKIKTLGFYETGTQASVKRVAQRREEEKEDWESDFFALSRMYVIFFGMCSLAINLFSILKPEFIRSQGVIPTHFEVFKDSLPHILYAVLILSPSRWVTRGTLFYLSFPLAMFGMLYYWYISVSIITKLSLHFMFVLVILPFSAIPAALVLVLLIVSREEWRQKARYKVD